MVTAVVVARALRLIAAMVEWPAVLVGMKLQSVASCARVCAAPLIATCADAPGGDRRAKSMKRAAAAAVAAVKLMATGTTATAIAHGTVGFEPRQSQA